MRAFYVFPSIFLVFVLNIAENRVIYLYNPSRHPLVRHELSRFGEKFKYYDYLDVPPRDFDPIYMFIRPGQCTPKIMDCDCPFTYQETCELKCDNDFSCPEDYKCCDDPCFLHRICKPILKEVTTETTETHPPSTTPKIPETTDFSTTEEVPEGTTPEGVDNEATFPEPETTTFTESSTEGSTVIITENFDSPTPSHITEISTEQTVPSTTPEEIDKDTEIPTETVPESTTFEGVDNEATFPEPEITTIISESSSVIITENSDSPTPSQITEISTEQILYTPEITTEDDSNIIKFPIDDYEYNEIDSNFSITPREEPIEPPPEINTTENPEESFSVPDNDFIIIDDDYDFATGSPWAPENGETPEDNEGASEESTTLLIPEKTTETKTTEVSTSESSPDDEITSGNGSGDIIDNDDEDFVPESKSTTLSIAIITETTAMAETAPTGTTDGEFKGGSGTGEDINYYDDLTSTTSKNNEIVETSTLDIATNLKTDREVESTTLPVETTRIEETSAPNVATPENSPPDDELSSGSGSGDFDYDDEDRNKENVETSMPENATNPSEIESTEIMRTTTYETFISTGLSTEKTIISNDELGKNSTRNVNDVETETERIKESETTTTTKSFSVNVEESISGSGSGSGDEEYYDNYEDDDF